MEYLEGQTVADRLAKAKLPIDQALKIGSRSLRRWRPRTVKGLSIVI
jgi:hypothetical protein